MFEASVCLNTEQYLSLKWMKLNKKILKHNSFQQSSLDRIAGVWYSFHVLIKDLMGLCGTLILEHPLSCIQQCLSCSNTHNSTNLLIKSPFRDEVGELEKEKNFKMCRTEIPPWPGLGMWSKGCSKFGIFFFNLALIICFDSSLW